MKELLKQYQLGDMILYYVKDQESEQTGLSVLPVQLKDQFSLEGNWNIDSLVQVKLVGDVYPDGFSQGHTMRNSDTTKQLKLESHECMDHGDGCSIRTTLTNDRIRVIHTVNYQKGDTAFYIQTEAENIGSEELVMECLSSFSLCNLSAVGEGIRTEDFVLHRMRSKWSQEGQLESQGFLELQLEPAWQLGSVQSIRYGEVGSMPVRMYFPWMVLEDTKYQYCIGAQLYHNASWQMEVYCKDEKYACSGGLADREFGHWMKKLVPSETFMAPKAVISTCMGDVDEISRQLTDAQKASRSIRSTHEASMPIVFNEFCTTWGFPTCEKMKQIVGAIAKEGFEYCVIDAGWYATEGGNWYTNMGDWKINQNIFPNGFTETVKAIKDAGMIPGLWFEMEVVGCEAEINEREDYLLHRDGYVIQAGYRRFFDMRKPEVIDYLSEKVIGILKSYGFGYLKIDYNDNIGIGCDGSDSLGEGLREYAMGTKEFIRKIRQKIPDIVIENCSSGGHRLEPSMMEITDMSSFSDAHECVAIPIIAANVTRAIRPEQSQIWAVLRAKDDDQRLYYTMSNTFLGRMCISGDVFDLNEHQWEIVREAMSYYRKVSSIIKEGRSQIVGSVNHSYRHPVGWQAVLRSTEQEMLVVAHKFYDSGDEDLVIELGTENFHMVDSYIRSTICVQVNGTKLVLHGMKDMDCAVVRLKRYC